MNHGIRAYQEADISSMGKEKMIVLLYEKMVSHFLAAENAAPRDRIAMTQRLGKAQRIVTELRGALDHEIGGAIADQLAALYDFVFQEILAMLVDRAPEHARNCQRVVGPLLAAWRQIPPGTADRYAAGQDGAKPARAPSETPEPNRAPAPAVGEPASDLTRLLSVSA